MGRNGVHKGSRSGWRRRIANPSPLTRPASTRRTRLLKRWRRFESCRGHFCDVLRHRRQTEPTGSVCFALRAHVVVGSSWWGPGRGRAAVLRWRGRRSSRSVPPASGRASAITRMLRSWTWVRGVGSSDADVGRMSEAVGSSHAAGKPALSGSAGFVWRSSVSGSWALALSRQRS